jgi:hypothetical protein
MEMQTRQSVDAIVAYKIAEMKQAIADKDWKKVRDLMAVMKKAHEILRGP